MLPTRRAIRRIRFWALSVVFASLFLCLGSLAALGHAVFYAFPYYPLETYMGQSTHFHKHWANPGLPEDYYAVYDSLVRQTTAGSFDWISLRAAGGGHMNDTGWNGWAFLVGPAGEIYSSNAFLCRQVTVTMELFPNPFVWNPGYQGYWRQENGAGGTCMHAYLTYDNLAVEAIR
jgi:hypothetical protein